MILNIISIAILIVSSIGLFILISRKFSVLASIDVESLPVERDRAVKDRIIKDRIRRHITNLQSIFKIVAEPLGAISLVAKRPFIIFYRWLLRVREQHKKHTIVGGARISLENAEPQERIEILLAAAHKDIEIEDLDSAEKKYIDILALDMKMVPAYEGLARVYMLGKEWEQAREVLMCACKIVKERGRQVCDDPAAHENEELHYAELLNDLASVHKKLGHAEAAWKCLKEAVDLQNSNPKFLDALIDIHVLLGQRLKAEKVLEQLRKANPDNNKIEEIEERIKTLSY